MLLTFGYGGFIFLAVNDWLGKQQGEKSDEARVHD